jgi:hypothetical protein
LTSVIVTSFSNSHSYASFRRSKSNQFSPCGCWPISRSIMPTVLMFRACCMSGPRYYNAQVFEWDFGLAVWQPFRLREPTVVRRAAPCFSELRAWRFQVQLQSIGGFAYPAQTVEAAPARQGRSWLPPQTKRYSVCFGTHNLNFD